GSGARGRPRAPLRQFRVAATQVVGYFFGGGVRARRITTDSWSRRIGFGPVVAGFVAGGWGGGGVAPGARIGATGLSGSSGFTSTGVNPAMPVLESFFAAVTEYIPAGTFVKMNWP